MPWPTAGRRRDAAVSAKIGYDYVHTAIDDHTRLAYSEIHPDEKDATCPVPGPGSGLVRRPRRRRSTSADRQRDGLPVPHRLGWVCTAWQLKRRFTKPGFPWTNGKAERFNRTLLTEWAHARPWTSNSLRHRGLDHFLNHYNTRGGHSALGGRPPISRLTA